MTPSPTILVYRFLCNMTNTVYIETYVYSQYVVTFLHLLINVHVFQSFCLLRKEYKRADRGLPVKKKKKKKKKTYIY